MERKEQRREEEDLMDTEILLGASCGKGIGISIEIGSPSVFFCPSLETLGDPKRFRKALNKVLEVVADLGEGTDELKTDSEKAALKGLIEALRGWQLPWLGFPRADSALAKEDREKK